MQRYKYVKVLNIIIIAVLIIVATIYASSLGSNNVSYSIANNTLEVTGPNKFSYSVEYENIKDFVYLESFEKGNNVNATSKKNNTAGIYNNTLLGDYNLCVVDSIDVYILVVAKDNSSLVFNYQDAEFTSNLYNTLVTYFNNNGYVINYSL